MDSIIKNRKLLSVCHKTHTTSLRWLETGKGNLLYGKSFCHRSYCNLFSRLKDRANTHMLYQPREQNNFQSPSVKVLLTAIYSTNVQPPSDFSLYFPPSYLEIKLQYLVLTTVNSIQTMNQFRPCSRPPFWLWISLVTPKHADMIPWIIVMVATFPYPSITYSWRLCEGKGFDNNSKERFNFLYYFSLKSGFRRDKHKWYC